MTSFDNGDAILINAARLNHLDTLGLDLRDKNVLQLGSGIGLLTDFWTDHESNVFSIEINPDNIAEDLKRHPDHKVAQGNAQEGLSEYGEPDIVFAYGILYHLHNPSALIMNAAMVSPTLLLETMVWPNDDWGWHDYGHFPGDDQGPGGAAFVPARDAVMKAIGKHFAHTYVTVTQPDHNQFPLKWPSENNLCRAVFVGSAKELNLPTLSKTLLMEQKIAGA